MKSYKFIHKCENQTTKAKKRGIRTCETGCSAQTPPHTKSTQTRRDRKTKMHEVSRDKERGNNCNKRNKDSNEFDLLSFLLHLFNFNIITN